MTYDEILTNDWISTVDSYNIERDVIEQSVLIPVRIDYDTIEYALTHGGIWIETREAAIELIMVQIAYFIREDTTMNFNQAINENVKRTGNILSNIIMPTNTDREVIVHSPFIRVDSTNSLDKEPFYSEEVILMSIDGDNPIFQLKDNYLCFDKDWKNHISRWYIGD